MEKRLPGWVMLISGLEVLEWSPGRSDENVPPTQVHILITVEGLETPLALRLKSRQVTDELINALIEHRDGVWPRK